MKNLKNVLATAAALFRKKVRAAKLLHRVIITGVAGFGLYFASTVCADFIHDVLSNHTAGAFIVSVLAVNAYVSYPTLKRGFTNLRSFCEKLFREPADKKYAEAPVMAATTSAVGKEKTFADIADEFAAEVATVSDEELREEE